MTKGIGLQKNIRRKTERTEAREGVQVPGKLTAMQADRQAAIQADMRTSKQTTGQADTQPVYSKVFAVRQTDNEIG